jgi:hypothetical protein
MCKSKGMSLMMVDDETESNDVSDFLKKAGLASESFHCSKKGASAGSCSVMSNSRIQTDSCDTKINFICEAKKYFYYINLNIV